MKILVTGSFGHLGEALVRSFRDLGDEVIGLDLESLRSGDYPVSPITRLVGSKGYHKQIFENGPYPV